MRKWMRDRLQRRKKKGPESAGQAAPPPLQPAYFDQDQASPSEADAASPEVQLTPAAEPEVELQPETLEASGSDDVKQPRTPPAATGDSPRTRGRRRRGGRGRGGRGREQAVAQVFTPAAAKGIIPEVAVDGVIEAGEETAPGGELEAAGPMVEPVVEAPKAPASVPVAAPRPPKGIVVLAIGLPGSGKSSWFKRHKVVPLSSDMVRSLLFDDVREQRFQDLVFSNLRSMLKARLIAKRPMNYVDATNLTPQERQHWVKLAKDYNYEVHAVFFDVPLEVCLERHQRRDRVVPEDVMRRMAAKLKAPAFEEGFAKITVVRVKKKE